MRNVAAATPSLFLTSRIPLPLRLASLVAGRTKLLPNVFEWRDEQIGFGQFLRVGGHGCRSSAGGVRFALGTKAILPPVSTVPPAALFDVCFRLFDARPPDPVLCDSRVGELVRRP